MTLLAFSVLMQYASVPRYLILSFQHTLYIDIGPSGGSSAEEALAILQEGLGGFGASGPSGPKFQMLLHLITPLSLESAWQPFPPLPHTALRIET